MSLQQVPPSPFSTNGPEPAKTGGQRLKLLKYLQKNTSYPKYKAYRLTETTTYRLGTMYEADYLREQIGLNLPSMLGMKTPLAQIENQPRNLQ